jgi:hypothetical protein
MNHLGGISGFVRNFRNILCLGEPIAYEGMSQRILFPNNFRGFCGGLLCLVEANGTTDPNFSVPFSIRCKPFGQIVHNGDNPTARSFGNIRTDDDMPRRHINGRADLNRYVNEDIQILHKQLSGRTKHIFNLENPNENGAFYNLLQHHGYPTPLLDWTYSPYVAVFFAYRWITNKDADNADPNKKVRVHVFDQARWKTDWTQLHAVLSTAPHFSVEEFMSIENQRMTPQQSASTLTNLDDIETYIKSKETRGKPHLTAIDLPVRERRKVMNELTYMGITAGSLFPGLDGACEELKERNFDI